MPFKKRKGSRVNSTYNGPATRTRSKTKYLNDEDIAPIEVAQRFAVEDLYYNDPFGLHQPKIQYKYLKILMKRGINNINY